MSVIACPKPSELKDYLSGRLAPGAMDEMDSHVENCTTCEQALDRLEDEPDTLVELLQQDETDAEVVPGESTGLLAEASIRLVESGEVASYQLIRRLGSGGMGRVYLARHRKLDKEVAIKILPPLAGYEQEFVARFEREMRAAGRLEHPAIVRTTDAGEHDGVHYLVMDVIDGLDLSQVASAVGRLEIEDACEAVRQAASGLAHAHELGIVHRDVKPSNLMLDSQGHVRILDFGLAQMDLWEKGSAEITTVGQLMGTLDYMAPEQAERGGTVDYRADLYALGATLFRLITGRAPLAAAPDLTPLEKLRLLSTHSAPKLSTLRSDVPEDLERLVSTMLDRDPSRRPASASHIAEALEPFTRPDGLPPLLEKARSQQKLGTSSLPAEMMSVLPAAQDGGDDAARKGRGFFWPAVACCMAGLLALGGILFIIETSKGQLVIDSQEANVTVKLRKDGKVARELTIEPGRQSTKLWGGEYEIEIESPSDRFTLSHDTFSILRGEIVIATIQPKLAVASSAIAEDTLSLAPEPPALVDERLNQIVYEGETLDTWLRRLKFEKSVKQRSKALSAISALAEPSLKDIIDPVIRELVSRTLSSDDRQSSFHILRQIHGYSLLPVADLFSDDVSLETRALRLWAVTSNRYRHTLSEDECALFLDVALRVAKDAEPRLVSYAWRMIDDLTRTAEQNDRVADLIQRIDSAEAESEILAKRMRDWYWFDKVDTSGGELRSGWNPMFRKAALRRAASVVVDSSNLELRTKAWLVLCSLGTCGEELEEQERKLVTSALKRVFKESATIPDWSPESVRVATSDARQFAGHVRGRDDQTGATSELTVALNVCREFELASATNAELQALHDRLGDFPLGFDRNRWPIELRASSSRSAFGRARGGFSSSRSLYAPAVFFRRTGELLGIPSATIEGRFKELRQADWLKYSELAIEKLQSLDPDAAIVASRCLPAGKNQRAAQAIVEYMPNVADQRYDLLVILARVSGAKFFENLAQVLKRSPEFAGEISLRFLVEYSCERIQDLQPLLDWADETLADAGTSGVLREHARQLLLSMLYDRSAQIESFDASATAYQAETLPISYECQQAIVKLLQKHNVFADDELWLTPVFHEATDRQPVEYRYDQALRETITERAIEQLATSPDSPVQRTMALACLRSVLATGDKLTAVQIEAYESSLRNRLEATKADFETASQRISLESSYRPWVKPVMQSVVFRERQSSLPDNSPARAYELVLLLQIARDLELTASVKELIAEIQTLATNRVGTSSAINNFNTRSGQSLFWSSINNEKDFAHLIAVMAGEMLGRDVSELLKLPEEKQKIVKLKEFNQVRPGDTLAIYIEAVLPMDKQPLPVMQAGTNCPVVGYPVPVHLSGEIVLPLVGRLKVADMQVTEVRTLIEETYVSKDILTQPVLSVEMLAKAGANLEIRALTTAAPPATESNTAR